MVLKNNKIGYAIIWIIIFMAFPFSIAQAYNLPAKMIMAMLTTLLMVGLLLKIRDIKVNTTMSFIFLFQIFTSFIYLFIHRDLAYINLLFQILVPFIIYMYISLFLNIEILSKLLIKLTLVMGVLSAICFILCLTINLPYYSVFQNPDGRDGFNFIISFTNTNIDYGFGKFIRPAGYFDEPGTLAFYIIIGILLNDLTIKNTKIQSTLMIVGLFTFSVAFYLILTLYGLLYLSKKSLVKILISFVFISFISVYLYSQLDSEYQGVIYGSSIGRLESIINPDSASNNFQADNRSNLISNAKEAIIDSPVIGQGISYASNEDSKFYGTFMSANFLGIFGIHGIIGGLIFSLHVFYYIYVCFKKRGGLTIPQKSCLIYLVLILQRPDYIGGILTYLTVCLLTLTSLNFKNVTQNIDNYRSL
ncbi:MULTISPECIES: hypothetical protein [unclassified Flavobacterium]|uniref:hypothetical protein n=1 Tax=unclassified Flavobacterium TaxID=196869 RepID=UPI0006AB7CA2|nr:MULTISPECIES: hypothetical protein [unclassified Flavobacterium]KOP39490.1 hypothetical protein AKO67_05185 [Flavobacterium sp. VMW]OWU91773.1 hypothetical protein APR43_06710 [Flavobacterium sp. NLM]